MATVLITGASKGIGEFTARAFCECGYNVVINYNTNKLLAESLANQLGCMCCKADIGDINQVKLMIEQIHDRYGKIDVLVNNAGICLKQKVLQDVTQNEFDSIVSTNLKGIFNVTKLALDDMIFNKNGSIINVSSVWGRVGASCEVVYSMTKAGIIGFTKALAKEVALSNVRVNAVAPGIIDTDMNGNLSSQEKFDFISENVPLNRIGTCKEVANAILFLASAKSSYITGQILGVDGGLC